jgi:chaperonin GroES
VHRQHLIFEVGHSGQIVEVTDYVEPLGMRVLIRKDEARQLTRGGIVLPDNSEIPTITGRVVEISVQIERDQDFPIRKYDRVLFHPKNAIPVDFEADNLLYVVPAADIVAVFRRSSPETNRPRPSQKFPTSDGADPSADGADSGSDDDGGDL